MIERDWVWLPISIPPARWRVIAQAVALTHEVTVAELIGPRRTRLIAHARQHAFSEIRRQTKLSLPQIGRFFNRDHSTVLSGINAHRARNGALDVA